MRVEEIKAKQTYRGGELGVERIVTRVEHGVAWMYCPTTQTAKEVYAMPVEWVARWAKEEVK